MHSSLVLRLWNSHRVCILQSFPPQMYVLSILVGLISENYPNRKFSYQRLHWHWLSIQPAHVHLKVAKVALFWSMYTRWSRIKVQSIALYLPPLASEILVNIFRQSHIIFLAGWYNSPGLSLAVYIFPPNMTSTLSSHAGRKPHTLAEWGALCSTMWSP